MSKSKLPNLYDPNAYTFYDLKLTEVEGLEPPPHGSKPLEWHVVIDKDPNYDATVGEALVLSEIFGFDFNCAEALIDDAQSITQAIYPGTHETCETMCHKAQEKANDLYSKGHVFRGLSINIVSLG
ncbi:MAG: hypothetical protein AAGB32_05330 [Pseudomonadota bacterium]